MRTAKRTILACAGVLVFLVIPRTASPDDPPPTVIRVSVDEAAERARELAERRARALSTTAAAQTAAGWLVLGGGVVAGAHMWRSTDDDMRLERVGAAGIGVGISVQGVALLIDAGKKRREARRIRASYSCR